MQIETIVVGYLETNCYLITKNNKTIIVDPGDDYSKIKSHLIDKNVVAIFITHEHFDHTGALKELVDEYNVSINPSKVEGFDYKTIKTPGHTNDSITFYFPDESVMFTGDFIFYQTIGRTDLPTGSNKEMKESLEIIKKYPDDITIYPGHYESTNLGDEKKRFDLY